MQRRPRLEDHRHLQFVRDRGCVICGASPCDPAHIKMADARVAKPMSSNIGMKADDVFVLPLCRLHHEEQHDMPERAFWANQGIDPVPLALRLYVLSLVGWVTDTEIEAAEAADQMLGMMRLEVRR